jgi:hypothetical protein
MFTSKPAKQNPEMFLGHIVSDEQTSRRVPLDTSYKKQIGQFVWFTHVGQVIIFNNFTSRIL